jgi:hypothetical protein
LDSDQLSTAASARQSLIRRLGAGVWQHIGFVCVAIVLAYCIIAAFDPPRLNWGDSMSDYNVMNSGRNFAQYGFLKLRLTPFLLDPAYMRPEDKMFIYTHYPQLPDLMNGVLRKVFGLTDIVQFRFVALLFSFTSLIFIYKLANRYWGRRPAQLALALWVVNPLWIQHADYLHHVPYGAFFGFGAVYLLTRYLDDERRWPFLAAAAVSCSLMVLASYDWWFFGPLLLAFATIAHYKRLGDRRVWTTLGVLAAGCIAGLAFKVLTNMWALGGWNAFISDFRFQFLERGTDTITRNTFMSGLWETIYGRVARFFTLLLFPVVAFWLAVPFLRRRSRSRVVAEGAATASPIILLAAALPFLCLFKEIWVGQYYPTLLVMPVYAIGFGALISLMFDWGRAPRIVAVALLAGLLANSLDEDTRFKKAFFPRETIRTLAAQLDSVAEPDQPVLVNHTFDAAYRYYFHRNSNATILIPPRIADLALASYADPVKHARFAGAKGAIFVEHKHVVDELYDKGFYYMLARYQLWPLWGNPPQYHDAINQLIAERDSILVSKVAAVGTKLYETDYYVIWRVPQFVPVNNPLVAEARARVHRN